jgi:hypothetical protein
MPCCSQGFGWHKLYVGPRCGCTECRRVSGIVLLAFLHEGFDCFRRNQLHVVSKGSQHTGPMMRGATRLQHDCAGFLLLKELDRFIPSQLAPDLWIAILIHSMNLEDGLGGIQANHGNTHPDRLHCVGSHDRHGGTRQPQSPRRARLQRLVGRASILCPLITIDLSAIDGKGGGMSMGIGAASNLDVVVLRLATISILPRNSALRKSSTSIR